MAKNILISGGSGMLGMRLSELLSKAGHSIAHLTRSKKEDYPYKQFEWDIHQEHIEPGAINFPDTIIHLAGAGIADERWTEKRKKVIIESRTKSAELIYEELKKSNDHHVVKYVSTSAIGYYGMNTGDKLLSENHNSGDDYLAEVVEKWEASADLFEGLGIPVSKLRVGVVLSKEGGALEKIAQPIKFGLGAALGSGDQYMSWIHIDDICQMFIYLVENEMPGVYNGVAPEPITNKEMTKEIANVLKKPLWLPNVPSFVLKLALGEMAGIVLGGNKVSSDKIEQAGYEFSYAKIGSALKDLYK